MLAREWPAGGVKGRRFSVDVGAGEAGGFVGFDGLRTICCGDFTMTLLPTIRDQELQIYLL